MAYERLDLERLQATLPELVVQIHKALNDDRFFLLDLKQENADFEKFPLPQARILPAIQWKLLNLEQDGPGQTPQSNSQTGKGIVWRLFLNAVGRPLRA